MRMSCAIVVVERARAEIGRFDSLSDDVRFSDPGSLRVRQHDGDGVAGGLESLHQGVDVGRGVVGGRSVVVYHLLMVLDPNALVFEDLEVYAYENMHLC